MHRNDPADMFIDERLDEVACVLAAGFVRLGGLAVCVPPDERETAAHFDGSGGLPVAAPANRSLTVAARIEAQARIGAQTAPSRSRLGLRRKPLPHGRGSDWGAGSD
jgi:hypothetical protein